MLTRMRCHNNKYQEMQVADPEEVILRINGILFGSETDVPQIMRINLIIVMRHKMRGNE